MAGAADALSPVEAENGRKNVVGASG